MDQRRKRSTIFTLICALFSTALLGACGSQKETLPPASGTTVSASTTSAGLNSCTTCHSQVTADWITSKHANLDPTGELSNIGAPALAQIAGCTQNCHNPNTDSNNLTDGSTGATGVLRPVIGCESCHGGGSLHVNAGGMGAISRLSGTFQSTTAVSGQFLMCTSCHELLNTAGTGTATAAHDAGGSEAASAQGAEYSITDTHFAISNSWNAITGRNNNTGTAVSGYAMDHSAESVCSDCHNPHKSADINRDWARSAHADRYGSNTADPLGFLSGAWSYYNWSCDGATASNCGTSSRKACQRCHTTTGFRKYADALQAGDYTTAEQYRSGSIASITSTSAFKPEMLKCTGCHTDSKGNLRNPGPITANYNYISGSTIYSVASHAYPDIFYSNICMACHTGQESGDSIKNLNASGMPAADLNNFSFINSHYLTGGGTVFGATGYEFGGRSYSNPSSYRHHRIGTTNEPNTGINGPCIGCHMSRPGGAGDHLFLPVGRDANGITGIASEVCFICHVMPNNMLTDSTNERREDFHAALEALKRELDKQGFYFAPVYPYFFNPRTRAGTVTLTDSVTVNGTGTAWSTAGIVTATAADTNTTADMFRSYDGTYYTIAAVNSDTQLTLSSAYTGPIPAGLVPYAIIRVNSSTYTTGKVSVTELSPVVVGSGTTWTAAGIVTGAGGTPFRDKNGVYYEIASVDSDTQLTLLTPYAGATAANQSYTIVKNYNNAKGAYTTGTVDVTSGSIQVTGTSTIWTSAGIVPGAAGDPFRDSAGNYYTIQSVDSDTQLTLSAPYAGATASGQSYRVIRYGSANGIKDWDPTDAGGSNGGTLAKNNMGAAFNFNVLEHDPGAYIHNSYYTRRLIYDAIDWLDDKNMNYSVGATLNSLTYETYKANAVNYLLPGGAVGVSGERP